ncbi:hypothetical protein Y1Q_0013986 [Alligator mississippiensis]|uniref:Uncharacterized protein n=1 Tax=Alligator mississippiensis TaxID=8496 RepID=A0A151PDJ4_ALLMI|nr:hypothetical protein Y1Q_0013986 [Alligator mississippiensis]
MPQARAVRPRLAEGSKSVSKLCVKYQKLQLHSHMDPLQAAQPSSECSTGTLHQIPFPEWTVSHYTFRRDDPSPGIALDFKFKCFFKSLWRRKSRA